VSRSQGHVLVVDDDPSARQSLADALRALDFDVHEAADGPSALRIVEATDPDVILLDVIMPGMDGYEVCRRLKEDPETALTPVIFLTGYGSREAKLEGLDAGATEFLSKPCELVELEIRVRNLVRFAQMTRGTGERGTDGVLSGARGGGAGSRNRRSLRSARGAECGVGAASGHG
jgi:DNA-binding response OmpR family regulator